MYREVKGLNLTEIDQEILKFWESNNIFEKSISSRNGAEKFVFYEGPPSANGKPGIHHVMSRTVKDLFCRYQTLKGKEVNRKGGWDTHGLPIELSVEKELGITKEDIGVKISIDDYNKKCRETVMQFKNVWDDLTVKMGYWVDLNHPYITFENEYIESVWWLLSEIYKKQLLYKGFTIQPYSPAAGTGLSSHELNQPGAYREVKDVSAVALFSVDRQSLNGDQTKLFPDPFFIAAWTTTPWTLPSNTALAVGEKIEYVLIETYNPYTFQKQNILLASELISKWFKPENEQQDVLGEMVDKKIPYRIVRSAIRGSALEGILYTPLFDYAKPDNGDAYKVLLGDFVSTEDGTGIVHIAPSFGADDMRVAKKYGVGSLTLVDKQGRFTEEVYDFPHEYVKEDYLSAGEKEDEKRRLGLEKYLSVDERIVIKLKKESKLLNSQKYTHNYPHCWRTDKPILYYPLDSWFIKVTAIKDRMVELNKSINWKPESTGTGRFGNWLENLQDWNLSRSRYWGIPLPVWRSENNEFELCISSVEHLKSEIEKANKALGLHQSVPNDLHRPYIDEIVLVADDGKTMMRRELDLIDVWFDSGSMPYAQWHYPFATNDLSGKFPADYIAEGVDQTRGWFYTLHAIGALVFDSIAYKNVVSNGLVLDKNGEKMSKRKGNVVDPFSTLEKYGADATRWYMISNADPWENLKFDLEGITEVRNKFFGTLFNTYSFFAIYANIDGFSMAEHPTSEITELDEWILSRLQNVISDYTRFMDDYEPTQAARVIEKFVSDDLSNWHVRLSRRRFWKSESSVDKQAAFETLYTCLYTVSKLISPLAPFFAEWLFKSLTAGNAKAEESVHLSYLPAVDVSKINTALERRMNYAQRISSLILAIRKINKLRVRQPLNKVLIPKFTDAAGYVFDDSALAEIEELIKSEVNVKDIHIIRDNELELKQRAKANFKTLGKRLGKHMKEVADTISNWDNQTISSYVSQHLKTLTTADGTTYEINAEDFEVFTEDIPGWLVNTDGEITVALDITLTQELIAEGTARELINRIQNIRKTKDFNVTDRIIVTVESKDGIAMAVEKFAMMIKNEVLADQLILSEEVLKEKVEWLDDQEISIDVKKV